MRISSLVPSRRGRIAALAGIAAATLAGSLTVPLTAHASAAPAAKNLLLKQLFTQYPEQDFTDVPSISALCQSFLGKPSPFNPPSPNVDAINGDTVVNVGSQTGCDSAQNETTVAVNPENPRNIVAGSNDYRVFNSRESRNDASGWAYTSMDGGRTWKDVLAPSLTFQTGATAPLSYMDSAGDPSIAFGPHNTVYYANLVFSRTDPGNNQQQASGIAVSVSHDGGLSWGQPKILELDGVTADGTPTPTYIFNDKEWIAADPHTGAVYVTWTRFTYDTSGNYLESPVVAVGSQDFGRTWSPKHQISPSTAGFTGGITSFGTGTNPQVADNGTLYVAYETSVCATIACNGASDHDAVVVATSRDHGRTFHNTEVATDYDFPVNQDVGNNTLTGENFRINAFPQLAYDRVTGKLWTTWADDRNGAYANGQSVKTNGAAFLASSRDGAHWSAAAQVGPGGDEVFPAVAAFAGRVAVSYYTRAYDPQGTGLDYAYAVGWDNQVAGAPQRRITTQTSDPGVQFVGVGLVSGKVLQGEFIGDYTAMAIGYDFQLHPVWTDFRGNPALNDPNQDVYTQSISALR